MLCYACFQGPARAFVSPFFFFFFLFLTSATQHCTPRTNQLFSPPEKSVLEMEDETKLGFMWLTHFEGPHSYLQITYCTFFFFLIVMTIVYLQISLFLMDSREGGFLEEVKLLHVTSDVIV